MDGRDTEQTTEAAQRALERAVADRKAQVGRTQQHLKAQLAKARQAGVATMAADPCTALGQVAREAEAKGVTGDELAGLLGAPRLSRCFWLFGFVPGLAVNALCAGLFFLLTERAVETPKLSIDGDSAAFFMAALLLPAAFSACGFAALAGRGVRAAGSRGYWRTAAGYALSLILVLLVLVVRTLCDDASLKVILYRG